MSKRWVAFLDKPYLEEMYLMKRLSASEIARFCKCSHNQILRHLRFYGIPIRSRSEQGELANVKRFPDLELLTKEFLEEEYVKKNKTIRQIEMEINVNSKAITKYLRRYQIPLKSASVATSLGHAKNNPALFKLTAEFLQEEYINKRKSSIKIGKELNIHPQQVLTALRRFGIPICWREQNRNWNWNGVGEISGQYLGSVKRNAEKRGLEFTVTPNYVWELFLSQGRKCALSGMDIGFREKYSNRSTSTASLDRINSDLGYIPGNVQWIHKKYQWMKLDMPQSEFKMLCLRVANQWKRNLKHKVPVQ